MSLTEIASATDLRGHKSGKAVLLFGADWHEACPMLEMVLGALASQNANAAAGKDDAKTILFGKVDAESATELTDAYEVTMVPTVLLLLSKNNNNKDNDDYAIAERLEGETLADPSALTLAVQRLVTKTAGAVGSGDAEAAGSSTADEGTSASTNAALNARLAQLVRMDTVVLFLKGTPTEPRCGFSRQAVELLAEQKVATYASFDILGDPEVRQGLKEYSDWPTYPQIYVRGELMGGLDIMKETAAEGSLLDDWDIANQMLATTTATSAQDSLNDRLDKLIRRHPIMLFMKGLPSNPKCGFSRQIVGILDGADDNTMSYDSFDILSDDEVRQGLKEYSDWPTFPQLYVNGELIGGLDIVKELQESGELEAVLTEDQ